MKEDSSAGNPDRYPSASSGISVSAGPSGFSGQRLDHALGALLPHMGLRGRRRSLKNGLVLVNGRPGIPSQRLREKDVISLAAEETDSKISELQYTEDGPRLLARRGGYSFFYKPAGLHSVALAGGGGASLENLLPHLVGDWRGLAPGTGNRAPAAATIVPQLLQRLDFGTSGIVCAADASDAAVAFRKAELFGKCEKRYVAVLLGRLEGPKIVKNLLRTDGCQKSAALERVGDKSRWTEFIPLRVWPVEELSSKVFTPTRGGSESWATLAACRIHRGARHQIRVHAALMGHALWGDPLYGVQGEAEAAEAKFLQSVVDPGGFFLHHGGISLPGAACAVLPPWVFLRAEDVSLSVAWLEKGIIGIGKHG